MYCVQTIIYLIPITRMEEYALQPWCFIKKNTSSLITRMEEYALQSWCFIKKHEQPYNKDGRVCVTILVFHKKTRAAL